MAKRLKWKFKLCLGASVSAKEAKRITPEVLERAKRLEKELHEVNFDGDDSTFVDVLDVMEEMASVVRRAKACFKQPH